MATFPACGFHSPVTSSGDVDGAVVDAGQDAGNASPSDGIGPCFGTLPAVCFSSAANAPTAAVILTGDIDTGASTLCDQHNDQMGRYCVIAGTAMQLPAGTFRAYGDRPLVLLSTTAFDLVGVLDVSSTSSGTATHLTGPGVVSIASCTDGVTLPTADSGGYGGSFGGKGGDGQRQDSNTQPASGPAVAFPTALRAGCPGGNGATTTVGLVPTRGGAGGGAVSIIAAQIRLGGTINASGAAGTGGPVAKSGAGGGGSGGMIVLDAPSIVASGAFALFANGGGGGQGGAGDGNDEGAGQSGGESTAPDAPGLGGDNDDTAGGTGGDGAAGNDKDGSNAATNNLGGNAGGGGGGGGGGFIHAPGVTSNIAPPSTSP